MDSDGNDDTSRWNLDIIIDKSRNLYNFSQYTRRDWRMITTIQSLLVITSVGMGLLGYYLGQHIIICIPFL